MTTVRSVYDTNLAAGLQRDLSQEHIVGHMDALVDALRRQSGKFSWLSPQYAALRGLYIWGDVGRGKSMLANMMIEAVPDLAPRRMHFHAFMRDIHHALHGARMSSQPRPLESASDQVIHGVTLLVLDELEITDIVDAMLVGRIFERILQQGVVLVLTANRAPPDLYQDGLKRDLFLPFVHLLESQLEILQLDNQKDYRRISATDTKDYQRGNRAAARKRIAQIWETENSRNQSDIKIGHSLILSMRNKTVRSSFDELCRNPLLATDYIQLALATDLLLLDDVPYMTKKDDDAVRRFIILIDAYYDTGRDIEIDLPASPEDLYTDGSFTQEYKRTVSRLYQMSQSNWAEDAAIK